MYNIEFSVYAFAARLKRRRFVSRDGSLAEITVLRGAIHILDSLRIFFAVYVCLLRYAMLHCSRNSPVMLNDFVDYAKIITIRIKKSRSTE